jgi:hypothetical protein
MAKDKGMSERSGDEGGPEMLPSQRMLVVIARPEVEVRARGASVASAAGADVSELNRILVSSGATIRPLFGASEERVQAKAMAAMPSAPSDELARMHLFYTVEAPDEKLDALAQQFAAAASVAGAYVTPAPQPASMPEAVVRERDVDLRLLNAMRPREEVAPATPDFTLRQGYLDPAPAGIDARYAWTLPGGNGAGVMIFDCEGAWRFTHEDLVQNQGGVIRTQTTDIGWRNHGTAVMGEIGGDRNAIGTTGIAADAFCRGSSIFDVGGLSGAIAAAADRLRPGDIILIEVQYGHPTKGWTSIEWWPADHAAIRYAVNRGVVVVEAAGNGNNDLDDPVYNNPLAGFPADWRNPFQRGPRDSGAILVGAGAPPPGTHGRDHGPDRSRLGFSNHGSALDVQGWGREVTTCGYGDLQGGANEDLWYTDQFSGTSSASPIVVGSLACVQGVLRAAGRVPLTPARARELLRSTGSPQQDAPGRPRTQRIGNRPNLRQLIPLALHTREWIGVQFTGLIPASATQRWFTWGWPAHWHVLWTVVPTSPRNGAPQISWSVQVERANDAQVTYWISITNHTPDPVNIEARYAVLGW